MIKDYIIKEILGIGAFGTIYKVQKKSNNKLYVVKKIPLIGLTSDQLKKAKLESQILSLVKSPYIVRYYESFEENDYLIIVMEYCDGGDLNNFISKNEQTKILLKENIIWNIFLKILIGLNELHKNKILHRDLKPHNIFLTKNNFDIKIGDFGISKILDGSNLTKTIIGTPYYLSPEICEELPYNDKSDVWALGCILYELCTYKHPFSAKSQASLIYKILNQKPKPIHEYYSKDLQKLIYLILDKNCEKRPSCRDILCLPFVKEKLKEFGLYDKIEFMHINKGKNNLKKNYSNGKYFTIKTNYDKFSGKKNLLFKNIIQRNHINKSYNNINKNIKGKNDYKDQPLFISKSTDNLKKLRIKKGEEREKNNGIIIQKEPKNNYRNYYKKNSIFKIKNNIKDFELKIKSERGNYNINKYPKNKKMNLFILDSDNDEEIFKNIKTNDILNNKEVDKFINDKLIKMKKEKKEINIKEFASFLNNNISKNNLTNFKYNESLTNRNEFRYKKIKNKNIDKIINNTNNFSFDINSKQKQDKLRKIEIINNIYNNKANKNNDIKKYKITLNNDSKILMKNKSFLVKTNTNKNKKNLNKNGNKILNRINSAFYNHKTIHKIQILDLTNK